MGQSQSHNDFTEKERIIRIFIQWDSRTGFLISNQPDKNIAQILTQPELKPELPRYKIIVMLFATILVQNAAFPVRTTILDGLNLHKENVDGRYQELAHALI